MDGGWLNGASWRRKKRIGDREGRNEAGKRKTKWVEEKADQERTDTEEEKDRKEVRKEGREYISIV